MNSSHSSYSSSPTSSCSLPRVSLALPAVKHIHSTWASSSHLALANVGLDSCGMRYQSRGTCLWTAHWARGWRCWWKAHGCWLARCLYSSLESPQQYIVPRGKDRKSLRPTLITGSLWKPPPQLARSNYTEFYKCICTRFRCKSWGTKPCGWHWGIRTTEVQHNTEISTFSCSPFLDYEGNFILITYGLCFTLFLGLPTFPLNRLPSSCHASPCFSCCLPFSSPACHSLFCVRSSFL